MITKSHWLTTKYLFLLHIMYCYMSAVVVLLFQGKFWLLGSRIKEWPLTGTCCSHGRGGNEADEIMQWLWKLPFGTGPLSLSLTSYWPKLVMWSCTRSMGRGTTIPSGKHCRSWQWGEMVNLITGKRKAGFGEHYTNCWSWRNGWVWTILSANSQFREEDGPDIDYSEI